MAGVGVAAAGRVVASSPAGRVQSTLLGLTLLSRGKREGLAQFDASAQGFLASLAPWIAFVLVDAFVAVLNGRALDGAVELVVLTCFILVPSVISQALSLLWHRDARWLRYITASTWCEWLMPLIFVIGWLLASLLVTTGLPAKAALFALMAFLAGYWLWLHFFLGRAALDLSRLRAGVLVAALFAGNCALFAIAFAFGGHARAMFGV